MKLSIITINLNNAEGLRKTMLSVIGQTDKDFEFIVIDGASTDNSLKVIKDCVGVGDQGMKVRWVSEPDTGIYNAMNKGIRMSSGNYLLFLNSGDWLADANVVETLHAADFKADIVVAKCNVVKDGKVVWSYYPQENYTFGTIYFYGIAHQSAFIRKDLFEKYGLYDESFRYTGDTEFWYRTIVDHKATTQALDMLVSNYCHGGLSDMLKDDPVFKEEHRRILSNPSYEKFLGDYEQWKDDKAWIARYKAMEHYPFIVRVLSFVERKKNSIFKRNR